MGFFSKLWKKTVGKVWKGIKKVAMKVGKFMNKIGIVGQIAMSFLLPGLGEILGGWAATMMGSSSAIVSGAGKFLNAAVNIGTKAGNVVKSISEGVGKVVGEVVGAVANKIPGMDKLVSTLSNGKINITDKNWGTVKTAVDNAFGKTGDAVTSLFSKDTFTATNKFAVKAQAQKKLAGDLGDPFRTTEQTMLEKIQATDLDTPRLADGSIDQFAIDPNMSINTNISETMGTTNLVASSTPSSLLQAPEPIENLFRSTPQTMLEKIQATDLDTPRLADGSIDQFAIDPNMPINPTVSKQLGVDELYSFSEEGSNFVPTKTESKLSAKNIAKAMKKTFGDSGDQGDGSYRRSIDVPNLDQDTGGVFADPTERRIRPIQVQGLYASPETVITSNWAKNMAQNLSLSS